MATSDSLRLRPGLPVVRRDSHHLQVGIEPPLCVVLPDEHGVRRLLDQLVAGAQPAPRGLRARQAWELLLAADLLVEEVVAESDPALAMAHGPEATARRQARSAMTVALDLPSAMAPAARRSMQAAGLGLVSPDEDPNVTLVADPGVVGRHRLDELVRHDRAHLVVHGGPQHWTVGPFVVPGHSACLRCVDAGLGEQDPRRAFVLEQAHRLPTPTDPLLRDLALTWAAHDLVRYAEGERPSTWSATVTVGTEFPVLRSWPRHPHCGCAWDLVLGESAS